MRSPVQNDEGETQAIQRYYPGKKDHHKRVTTERPHFTGGAPHPAGVGPPPGRTRKGEVDSDSLFRVFRWIPWLISDPSGAAIGCCWTESASLDPSRGVPGRHCPPAVKPIILSLRGRSR